VVAVKRKLQAEGAFVLDDLLNSKLPDHCFDVVMSFGLLEHFEDLQPLTASLTRPLAGLEPVYQAEGAYLTIYRWSRQ
jgi:hypothetical protein